MNQCENSLLLKIRGIISAHQVEFCPEEMIPDCLVHSMSISVQNFSSCIFYISYNSGGYLYLSKELKAAIEYFI
jgi:hypothetical protein